MERLRSCLVVVAVALLLPAVGLAQLKINNIEIVNFQQQPTGNVVVSQPGGSLTFRNDFSSAVIVRFCAQGTGEVLAEETIEPGSETHSHGRPVGKYDIKVAEPVAPPGTPPFVDCGDLKVIDASDG